jgi:hypothetical protein
MAAGHALDSRQSVGLGVSNLNVSQSVRSSGGIFEPMPAKRTNRDWVFLLIPAAIAGYFLIYPDHLTVFMAWLKGVIR